MKEHSLREVVSNLGGELVELTFKPLNMPNGGCGSLTYVDGTNGGTMTCGAMLTQLDGTRAPYYCAHCRP